jgi:hypothetical protein
MKTLYPLTQIGFILITIVYMYFFVRTLAGGAKRAGFSPSRRRSLIIGLTVGTIAWLAFISVLAYHQFFSDFQSLPPKFAIVVFVPLIIILYLAFTRTALEIISNIDPTRIVVLQTFRVFVEILLWMLFVDQLLPVQMTFEGYNFDILAGLTAPVIAWAYSRTKSALLLKIWNIACLCLLINIVTIAILSTPVPFRVFMNEPANTIVTQFPIVWLPGLLVPLAYTLHILSLRQASALARKN